MNEQNEESRELEQMYAETLQRIHSGEVVKGRVIAVKSDGVVVDIGYKSEGTIPATEFSSEELKNLKTDDELYVFIERINDQEGVVYLSRERASKIKAWESLSSALEGNMKVDGKVTEKTKGGLIVNVLGIKAFLPGSQIDVKPVKNLDAFVGQTIPLKILKMIPARHGTGPGTATGMSLIVSRRSIIEDETKKLREETLKELKEGAVLKGTVKNITDYGVFVDLGGIDGLLHISDISWGRVSHPSEFFAVGDEREFVILKFDETTQKVTLGYKQKKPNPWLSVDERYHPGMTITGKVVNVTDYGVFVEVEEGLEGLIHISELDWSPRQKHPSKYVAVGDEIETKVISVNKDEKRLSLSLKQLRPRPWELIAGRYHVGQTITGKVKTITDFGAFVRLPEGVDGLIHIADLSWTKHIKHPSELLKKGQKIDAVILSVEPERERMALGIKQLTPDPWEAEIPAKFRLGEEFRGKVLRKSDFGIFVELDNSVEGLIYSSEVDTSREINESDEIWVRIIKMNVEERKIGLSMKNVRSNENQ
ncbi:MAG TPA: 30S ribosomal protein S1 [Dissulfurispiraceae bacterium]|nr:30S ribosomal protein S1 [Dissulfurispiraceae bacterium]